MHLNPTRLFNIPIKINDLIAIKCLQKGVEMKVHTKVTTANTGNGLQHTSCAKLQSQYIFDPCTKISREIKMKITISDRSNAYLMYSSYLIVKVFQSMVNVSIDMERMIIFVTFFAITSCSSRYLVNRSFVLCLSLTYIKCMIII